MPFGLQRPARQSEAVKNAIAEIRARDFICMNSCRDACPLSIIFWHNINEIVFPSVFKKSSSGFSEFCSGVKSLFGEITVFTKIVDFLLAPYLESF